MTDAPCPHCAQREAELAALVAELREYGAGDLNPVIAKTAAAAEALITRVRQEEREKCAQIAENKLRVQWLGATGQTVAAAIRQGGRVR